MSYNSEHVLYDQFGNVILDYLPLENGFGEWRVWQSRSHNAPSQAPLVNFIQRDTGECAIRWQHPDDGVVGGVPAHTLMGKLGRGVRGVPHPHFYIWIDGQEPVPLRIQHPNGRLLIGGKYWDDRDPEARIEVRAQYGEDAQKWKSGDGRTLMLMGDRGPTLQDCDFNANGRDLETVGFINYEPKCVIIGENDSIEVNRTNTILSGGGSNIRTIRGGTDGDLLILSSGINTHNVCVLNYFDNVILNSERDYVFHYDKIYRETLVLINRNGKWMEVSRSGG
jgi:hypothetical protein